jgi:hypothetical protein
MPYLLDGNNLIGSVRRTARPSAEDRTALIAEIAGRLRETRARATIFFDGPVGQRPTSLGSLAVRVASGCSADDAIVRELERSRAPGETIVVTADRGLASRVLDAGGKLFTPDEFFSRFGRGQGQRSEPKRPEVTGKVDVDDWLRYFGDEKNRE